MIEIHSENEGLNPMQPPVLRAKPDAGFYATQKYRMILPHLIGKEK
jgi:hypothetical protein